VSSCHAGPTCPRGRRRARALLGLGRRWAERKLEEEVDCTEKQKLATCGRRRGEWAVGRRVSELAERERERKREGENGPARGRAGPREREEAGRAAWAGLLL
jgi:hypothetical protein